VVSFIPRYSGVPQNVAVLSSEQCSPSLEMPKSVMLRETGRMRTLNHLPENKDLHYVALIGQQQVLGFQVSVYNSFLVQVFQPQYYLGTSRRKNEERIRTDLNNNTSAKPVEPGSVLVKHFFLLKVIEEFASINKVHHEVQLVWGLEAIMEFNLLQMG